MSRKLGSGAYGAVYLAKDENNKQYAIKIINRNKLKKTQEFESKEMDVLKAMVHKNVVKLHEIIDDPNDQCLYLVMDYLPGGTLAEKLSQYGDGLPDEQVRLYMRQLVSAIHYCHEVRSLSHRDIKPENMMLDGNGKLVLCDFGISEFFKSSSDVLQSVGGTV